MVTWYEFALWVHIFMAVIWVGGALAIQVLAFRIIRAEDPVGPGAVFFPMHRIERMELDARSGQIPSLCERFRNKTGRDAEAVLLGKTSERKPR